MKHSLATKFVVASPAFFSISALLIAAHAGTASAQGSDRTLTLEEVIVTAQKREETLLNAPLSVTSLSAATMEKRGIQGLNDLQSGAIPSLKIGQFANNPATLVVSLRGQSASDAGSLATESPVGIYVDGVYLGRAQGLSADAIDLERIEVLRGPQGTLYGRNTIGGVVHMITQKPSGEWGFKQTALYSPDFDQWRSVTRIDFPAVGNLSARLSYLHFNHDGYVENPSQANLVASENFNVKEQDGARLALRWKQENFSADYAFDWSKTRPSQGYFQFGGADIPADVLADPLRLPAGFEFATGIKRSVADACAVTGIPADFRFASAGDTVIPDFAAPGCLDALGQNPANPQDPTANFIDRTDGQERADSSRVPLYHQRSTVESKGHTLTLSFVLPNDWELKSISSFRELDQRLFNNFNGALTGIGFSGAPIGDTLDHQQFSQEFQFIGDALDERIEYVGGLYYFEEEAFETQGTFHQVYQYIQFPVDIGFLPFAPLPLVDDVTGNPISLQQPAQLVENNFNSVVAFDSSSWAVFGQATIHASDNLGITVGARWTEDEREGLLSVSNFQDLDNPIRNTQDDEQFDWSATINWSPSDALNTYLRFATGYKSGGVSRRAILLDTFESETLESWELGLKARFFAGRMSLNAAYFLSDFKDKQFSIPEQLINDEASVANSVNLNATGTTEIDGLEIEFAFVISEGLVASLDYTYTDWNSPDQANISLPNNDPDFDTSRDVYVTTGAPRHSGTFAINYEFPRFSFGVLDLNVNWNSQSRQFIGVRALEVAAAFDVLNARLTLSEVVIGRGQLKAALWGKNLSDEGYIVSLGSFPQYARVFNEPRTAGVEFIYEF